MEQLKTPVVFLVFNRPETTRAVFAAIETARPTRLLVVADGPRQNRPGEAKQCEQVREIAQKVTWPCQLDTNFSAKNMGCRERVISGLNWAFSLAEEAIILEDDCLPDPSFFPYCSELLSRFRNDSRIGMISGDNFIENSVDHPYSYSFSQVFHIWGWATWRSSWEDYDPNLRNWPAIKSDRVLSEVISDPRIERYWSNIFDQMYNGTGCNTWDYQWVYCNLINNKLSVVPRKNLITNIGFGRDATHTADAGSPFSIPRSSLAFPLSHPSAIVPLRSMDHIDMKLAHLPNWKRRISLALRRRTQSFLRCVRREDSKRTDSVAVQ